MLLSLRIPAACSSLILNLNLRFSSTLRHLARSKFHLCLNMRHKISKHNFNYNHCSLVQLLKLSNLKSIIVILLDKPTQVWCHSTTSTCLNNKSMGILVVPNLNLSLWLKIFNRLSLVSMQILDPMHHHQWWCSRLKHLIYIHLILMIKHLIHIHLLLMLTHLILTHLLLKFRLITLIWDHLNLNMPFNHIEQ